MIKRLRRKFVIIAAVCLLVVETLIIGSINAINIIQINREEDELLSIIAENDGSFPEFKHTPDDVEPPPDEKELSASNNELKKIVNEETRYQTRYFTVSYNEQMRVERVDTGHIASVTSDEAVEFASQALSLDAQKGYIDGYKYMVTEQEDGKTLCVFLDCRKNISTKSNFAIISLSIAAAGYVIVCVLIIVFSKRAVRPFMENYEKQRRFITDAGHEIKTPLAIISANTEVIEMTGEPSEWTQSIKNQIVRLNSLIANLLKLSKMEEDNVKLSFCEFDLSEAFEQTVTPFQTLAEINGKTLKIDCEKQVRLVGDEASIRQLVSVFTENAVKYSDEGGLIKAELYKSSNGKSVKIRVSDSCKVPPQGDLNRLFDRFYRADSSRTRSDGENKSGYGIGLSIAKAVCDAHKGKISCKAVDGEIIFTAAFKI